jgi:hypothetical protein
VSEFIAETRRALSDRLAQVEAQLRGWDQLQEEKRRLEQALTALGETARGGAGRARRRTQTTGIGERIVEYVGERGRATVDEIADGIAEAKDVVQRNAHSLAGRAKLERVKLPTGRTAFSVPGRGGDNDRAGAGTPAPGPGQGVAAAVVPEPTAGATPVALDAAKSTTDAAATQNKPGTSGAAKAAKRKSARRAKTAPGAKAGSAAATREKPDRSVRSASKTKTAAAPPRKAGEGMPAKPKASSRRARVGTPGSAKATPATAGKRGGEEPAPVVAASEQAGDMMRPDAS